MRVGRQRENWGRGIKREPCTSPSNLTESGHLPRQDRTCEAGFFLFLLWVSWCQESCLSLWSGAQTLVDLVQLEAVVVTVGLGPAAEIPWSLCKGSNVEMLGKR